ncbi:MAG: PDZ domain-containing protein, partial [Candidatus Dadabacteria bacterium]|nr:PDZ domain-containing protein [Candidatus Dadabacteria bacterium]
RHRRDPGVDPHAGAGDAGEFPGDVFAGEGSSGAGVYIGALPDYSGDGPGVKLLGVVADSPAERVGLRSEDRVVSVSGKKIGGVDDYIRAVGEMSPGERLQVTVERGGRPVTVGLVPEKR